MNNNADPRGTLTRGRNFWSVNNALVEEVRTNNNRSTGYIVISYAAPAAGDLLIIDTLRLNVHNNTLITNRRGQRICICDISEGMWLDADFSPYMTRSIPPQSNAIRIMVPDASARPGCACAGQDGGNFPGSPLPPSGNDNILLVSIDRIVRTEPSNSTILVGNPINPNRQTRFVVSNQTEIFGRNGARISFNALRSGDLVEITHSSAQTLGIPPQSAAFRIQVL